MALPEIVGQTKKGPSFDEALPAFDNAGALPKVAPSRIFLGRVEESKSESLANLTPCRVKQLLPLRHPDLT